LRETDLRPVPAEDALSTNIRVCVFGTTFTAARQSLLPNYAGHMGKSGVEAQSGAQIPLTEDSAHVDLQVIGMHCQSCAAVASAGHSAIPVASGDLTSSC
jgi:hypothetical protein